MLNWPGRNRGVSPPAAGSSWNVQLSAVSGSAARTRYGCGASGGTGAEDGGSGGMDVQQLHARVLESLGDHRQEAEQELVALDRVLVEAGAQARGIDADQPGRLHRPRVQPPLGGGNEPRPAQDLVRTDRLDRPSWPVVQDHLERDLAGEDEVECVGDVALSDDPDARVVRPLRGE